MSERPLSPEQSAELENCKLFANTFYNEFSSVYVQIQEVMQFETSHIKGSLIVLLTNYYKTLLRIVSEKLEINYEVSSWFFTQQIENDEVLYNYPPAQKFKESNLSDFTKLVDTPCNWVGQSCYNCFSKQDISNLRESPLGRIILFLLDCLLFLKIKGRIYSLNELKPLIIVDFAELFTFTTLLPSMVNILIKSQSLLCDRFFNSPTISTHENKSIYPTADNKTTPIKNSIPENKNLDEPDDADLIKKIFLVFGIIAVALIIILVFLL